MTYKQIAETVLRPLAGGDISQDFPVKLEEVYIRINQMVPFLIRKDFYETYQIENGSGQLDSFIYTTFLAKVFKNDCGEQYAVLPNRPLVMHGRGVPVLSYLKDRISSTTYVEAGQYRMYKTTGVLNDLKGIVFFYEFDDASKEHRLIFTGDIDDCIECIRVRMVQVSNIADLDIDSDVPIGDHLVEPLIQLLHQWYSGQDREVEDSVVNSKNDKA